MVEVGDDLLLVDNDRVVGNSALECLACDTHGFSQLVGHRCKSTALALGLKRQLSQHHDSSNTGKDSLLLLAFRKRDATEYTHETTYIR